MMNNKKEGNMENNIQTSTPMEEKEVKRVDNRNMFFTVVNSINKYLDYIVKQDTKSVYLVLDPEYIQKNSITEQNVLQFVDDIKVAQLLLIQEMYEEELDEYHSNFYAYGTIGIQEDETGNAPRNDFYIEVKVNYEEETFAIVPLEKFPNNIKKGGN